MNQISANQIYSHIVMNRLVPRIARFIFLTVLTSFSIVWEKGRKMGKKKTILPSLLCNQHLTME
jgi:hypothetical protein